MREIKFRCWDGEKMWYPETLSNDDNNTQLTIFNKKEGSIGWGLYDIKFEYRICSGEYDELMQFTGLKDKNGVEIYEGDIIQDEDSISIIDMSNPYWCGNLLTNISQCEVIGNIYESKDLLQ